MISSEREQEAEHKIFISGKIGSAFCGTAPSLPGSDPSRPHHFAEGAQIRRNDDPSCCSGDEPNAAMGDAHSQALHWTGSRAGVERNGVGLQRGVSSIDTALEKEKRDKKPRPQRTFRTDELLLSTNQKPDLGIAFDTQLNLFYHV